MTALSNLRETLSNLDYNTSTLAKVVPFVPGLSLVAVICQFSKTSLLLSNDVRNIDVQSRKYLSICKWHLRGSMAQILALTAAVVTCANSAFLLMSTFALCELVYVGIKACKSVSIYEFNDSTSTIKTIESVGAFNIF